MKIILLKQNIYTGENFFKKTKEFSYLNGIYVDVTITKDGAIIPYNYNANSGASLEFIQNSTLEKLQSISMRTLEDFLRCAGNYKDKIILHLLPLLTPVINDDNIELINQVSEYFVKQVIAVANKFPQLNISFATSSMKLLYFINQERKKQNDKKVGLVLRIDDFSYQDVDFYVFNTEMFDIPIMNQQLDLNKEIMMYLITSSHISTFMRFFEPSKLDAQRKRVLDHLQIITPYPEIINRIFK